MIALRVSLFILFCTISSVLCKSFFEWDTILPVNNEKQASADGEKFKRKASSDGNEQRTYALSELIDNIENGLVRSALSARSAVSNSNPTVTESVDPNSVSTPSEHELGKRLTSDGENVEHVGSSSGTIETTEKILGSKGQPTQMIVDKINVFKLPVGIIPLPTFQIRDSLKSVDNNKKDGSAESSEENQDSKIASATTNKLQTITSSQTSEQTFGATVTSTEALTAASVEVPKDATTDESTKQSVRSTVASTVRSTDGSADISASTTESPITAPTSTSRSTTLAASTTSATSSTTASPTSTTTSTTTTTKPPSTTTKTPIVELKEAEEDLKEKVAEIEADPIILSARV